MRWDRSLALLGTAALLAACGGGAGEGGGAPAAAAPAVASPAPTALTADQSHGQQVYRAYCMSCHSVDGRGLAPLGIDLTESRFVAERSDPELQGFLRRGRDPGEVGSLTGRQMPGLAGLPDVGEAEVAALVSHLRRINRSS
ncbi:MAG TPA: cytochrome c [Thermoanaerobaculia bacterium]|nr:cytochrome c [Thermoanaerobaculia bacterium]